MNRHRLTAAALVLALGVVAQAGEALAEDATPTPGPSAPSAPTASASPTPTPTVPGPSTPSSPAPTPTTPGDAAAALAAPVAAADTATVVAGASVDIAVLANDADTDGQPLTLTAVEPAGGRAVRTGSKVRFTARPADRGAISFGYTVTSGGESATGRVTVTVTAPPAPKVTITSARIYALHATRIHGLATPPSPGPVRVVVQRLVGGKWKRLDADNAGPKGKWGVTYRTNKPRKVVFRAVATFGDGRRDTSGRLVRKVRARVQASVSGPLARANVPHSWRAGCPVPPKDLRRITINRFTYKHVVARGSIVVRASAAPAILKVFKAAFKRALPGALDAARRPVLRRRTPYPHPVGPGRDARRQHLGVQLPAGDREPLPRLAALLRQRDRHQHRPQPVRRRQPRLSRLRAHLPQPCEGPHRDDHPQGRHRPPDAGPRLAVGRTVVATRTTSTSRPTGADGPRSSVPCSAP